MLVDCPAGAMCKSGQCGFRCGGPVKPPYGRSIS
jgi:hypothetical protein